MKKTNNFSILEHFKHSWRLAYEKRADIARMTLLPVLFLVGAIYGHFLSVQVVSGILCFLSFFAFSICSMRLFYGKTVGDNPTRLAFKGVFWRTLGASFLYGIGVRVMTMGMTVVFLSLVPFLGVFSSNFFADIVQMSQSPEKNLVFTLSIVLILLLVAIPSAFYFSVRFWFMTVGAPVGKRWSFTSSLYLTSNRFWFSFGNFLLIALIVLLGLVALGGIGYAIYAQHLVWLNFVGMAVGLFIFLNLSAWGNSYTVLIYKTLLKHNQMVAEKV